MRVVRFLGIVVFGLVASTLHAQNRQRADSLYSQGIDYYYSGHFRQSEFCLREAFQFYNKNNTTDKNWLVYGIDYAEILVYRSKYDAANQLFFRLLKSNKAKKNIVARARIQNDLGWTYNTAGKNDKALLHLKKAIPLAKSAKDTLRLGYIYNNIGLVYYHWGKYNKSLKLWKQSLVYKEATKNKRTIARALNNIGSLYNKLCLYDKAQKYYDQSLNIRKGLGDVSLLATAYSNLAQLYQELGQYDQALSIFEKSLEYSKKAGEPSATAIKLNNIGTLYSILGQPERALQYYEQSLQLRLSFAGPQMLAVAYKNIGSKLWDLGRHDEAAVNYRKALALRKETGNKRAIARSLLDLVLVEGQENLSGAYDYAARAQAIADSTGDQLLRESAADRIGSIQEAKKNFPAAIHFYKQALKFSQQLSAEEQLGSLVKLAKVYDKVHSDSALYYGGQAVDIIEKQRARVGGLSNLKMDYFRQYSDFYVDMASWALTYRQAPAESYHYVELSKARSLTDELNEAAQRMDEILPEKVRLHRAQMQADISRLYSSLLKTSEENKKEVINEKIRRKELNYASFENNLHQKYPAYKNLKSPTPISLKQAQETCGPQSAILEYALNDQKLIAFLITNENVQSRRFALHSTGKTSDLLNEISQFRNAIIAHIPEDSLARLGKPIYQKLVAPFAKKLATRLNLTIIPDNYLAYLPFEALKEKNNYLVSEYNIKYLPSMTSLTLIHKPWSFSRNRILAVGNSSGEKNYEGSTLLPSLDLEISEITRLFDNATTLRDQEVTEEKVKANIQKPFSVVHIAAHSVIDERHSFMSGIVLNYSNSETGLDDDGKLRSSEIYRLTIPSNLVVLSACESGLGDVVEGEGMLGMQRAFLDAGAATVVVSLWNVYDRPTTKFMQFFYQSYLQDNDQSWSQSWHQFLRYIGWNDSLPFGKAAGAMRAAKLKMLHSAEYHHPVYWAPFIAVGR